MNTTTSVPRPGPHLFPAPALAAVVDCKPDRPLTGPGTVALADLIHARYVDYLDMPFLSLLNERVGVDWRTDLRTHLLKRDRLFVALPVTQVAFSVPLVVTQERVNLARVEQLTVEPKRGGRKPVDMVLHEGSYYVVNGHHRLASRWPSGYMDAQVLPLP